ncbi:Putative ribonuclease H protein At1g65750 [Linum perenne]
MLDGAKSAIRDGTYTLFWTNIWVESGKRLIDEADTSVQGFNIDSTMAEFTTEDGQWDFDSLHRFLPQSCVDVIAGMSPPQQSRGPDDWVWGCEKSGIFTIKSAYNLICRTETTQDSDRWKCVWSWAGPNRIRYFLWLVAKERLLTNTARLRRGLTQDASCPQCTASEESISHILRDCPFAVETWRRVEGVDINGGVWQEPYQTWLQVSLRSDADLKFGITCWYLWRARNERIFANSTENPATVALKCSRWRATVQKAMERDTELVDGRQPRVCQEVAWHAGRTGWVTLNSDDSVNRGKAAAGGILRDSNGKGLLAYTMNLGICSITKAEIRGGAGRYQTGLGGGLSQS